VYSAEVRMLPERPSGCHAFFLSLVKKSASAVLVNCQLNGRDPTPNSSWWIGRSAACPPWRGRC